VKKLTGGFDNGLGAILIGELGLGSFLSKRSSRRYFGSFSTVLDSLETTWVSASSQPAGGITRWERTMKAMNTVAKNEHCVCYVCARVPKVWNRRLRGTRSLCRPRI